MGLPTVSCYVRGMLFLCVLLLWVPRVDAWMVKRDFNDGAIGGTRAQGTADGFDSDAGGSYYSNEHFYEGGQAAELNISEGKTGFGIWGGVLRLPTHLKRGDEIWLRVRTYLPSGFDYDSTSGGNKLKFLRVHTRSASNSNEGYNDWYITPAGFEFQGMPYPFAYIGEFQQRWVFFGDSSVAWPNFDQWGNYEMYIKLDNQSSDEGGSGTIRMWENGKLLVNITNRQTLKGVDSYVDRVHIFTYWNGGAPKTEKMWIDDVVITNETPGLVDGMGNPYIGAEKEVAADGRPLPSPVQDLIVH